MAQDVQGTEIRRGAFIRTTSESGDTINRMVIHINTKKSMIDTIAIGGKDSIETVGLRFANAEKMNLTVLTNDEVRALGETADKLRTAAKERYGLEVPKPVATEFAPGDFFKYEESGKAPGYFIYAGSLNGEDYFMDIKNEDEVEVFTISSSDNGGFQCIAPDEAIDAIGEKDVDRLTMAGRAKFDQINFRKKGLEDAKKAFGWIKQGNYDEAVNIARGNPIILLAPDEADRKLLDHLIQDGEIAFDEIKARVLVSRQNLLQSFQHSGIDPFHEFLNEIAIAVLEITKQVHSFKFEDDPTDPPDVDDPIVITADDNPDDDKKKRDIELSDTDKWLSAWGKEQIIICATANTNAFTKQKSDGVPTAVFFSKALGVHAEEDAADPVADILQHIYRTPEMDDAAYKAFLAGKEATEPKFLHFTQDPESKEYTLHIAHPLPSEAEAAALTEAGLTANSEYDQQYLGWCAKHGAERAGLKTPEFRDVPIVLGGRGQNVEKSIQGVNYKYDKLHLELRNHEHPDKPGKIEAGKNKIVGNSSSDEMIAGLVALAKEMPAKRYNIAAKDEGLIKIVKAFDAHNLTLNKKTQDAFLAAMNAKHPTGGCHESFEAALKAAKPAAKARVETEPAGG